jgi:single-strand DNA-binding protein
MSSRSLNKVQLIGNLTRDPELRYTPTGAAVCTIGLATNRAWTTEAGEKKEETEFHRVVAWNKLAELCSQLLVKGRKIYVEGRLRTNAWQTTDGQPRSTTEVVIEDMIILDSRRPVPVVGEAGAAESTTGEPAPATADKGAETTYAQPAVKKSSSAPKSGATEDKQKKDMPSEEVNPDDIPF